MVVWESSKYVSTNSLSLHEMGLEFTMGTCLTKVNKILANKKLLYQEN